MAARTYLVDDMRELGSDEVSDLLDEVTAEPSPGYDDETAEVSLDWDNLKSAARARRRVRRF